MHGQPHIRSATECLLMRSVACQLHSLHTTHYSFPFIKAFPFLPKFPELFLFHKFVITTYEYQCVTGVLSLEVKRPGVILTTYLQLGPKLRMIGCTAYDPKYENGEWKSRTNRELEEISKGENIVKWIKGQRISRLGH